MPDLIKKFFSGIGAIKRKSGTYKKLSIEELTTQFVNKNLDYVDLSGLDLRNYGDFFMSHPTGWASHTGVYGWTENVIWPTPDKMPIGFNPQQYIDTKKHQPETDALHQENITGRGINIAIIDSLFNPGHAEYKDNIKYFQGPLIKMPKDAPKTEHHGSMVVGCAVGKKVAEKIIVELKNKIGGASFDFGATATDAAGALPDLLAALESLGYRRLDIIDMAQHLVAENPGADVATLVPMALKQISGNK